MKALTLRMWLVVIAALLAELLPLPAYLAPLRPPLATLVAIYWALMWPGRFGVFSALVLGLAMDIASGTLLGQNALALSLVIWVVARFHLQMRVFPLWQLTLSVFALACLAALMRLWIDGIIGVASFGPQRFGPVLAAGVLWPLLMALLDRTREHFERRESRFT